MKRRGWSTTRILVDTATLGVALAALLACRSARDAADPGVGVLALLMAAMLAAAADRAWFGARRRAFWLGCAATGGAVAALGGLPE